MRAARPAPLSVAITRPDRFRAGLRGRVVATIKPRPYAVGERCPCVQSEIELANTGDGIAWAANSLFQSLGVRPCTRPFD